jgi:ketosteroid isomerase-like protein
MKTKTVNSVWARRLVGVLAAAVMVAAVSSPLAAQSKKNKNQKVVETPQTDPNAPAMPLGSDADQIDRAIGEMLAAFQIGDVELMHKHYADNVTFVSGAYEPPIVGWQNYLPLYQRQRAAFQGIQVVRRNTIVFPHGDVAWAMYQWEFDAMLNNQPFTMRGQATLVLNKINGIWLIVHNHTSELSATQAPAAQSASQVQAPASAKP